MPDHYSLADISATEICGLNLKSQLRPFSLSFGRMDEDENHVPDGREVSFYEDLAYRLKLAVEALPDSKGDVAESIGVSQNRMSNWITNQNRPDWFAVAKLCQRYRISADWILLGDVSALPYRMGVRLERAVAEKKAGLPAADSEGLETVGSFDAPPIRRKRKPNRNPHPSSKLTQR